LQKLENKERVFGIVVLFGFETKNFFGSGLYKRLSENHKMVVFRREFPTKNFNEYIKKFGLDVTILEKDMLVKNRLKCETLFHASRKARNRLKNIENFNYFTSDRKIKFTDYILGNYLVNKLLNIVTMGEVFQKYFNGELQKIFNQNEVTDLIMTGYSSLEGMTIANTALQNGCNVWLVINSWKDFYVNDLIPFTPTKTFVWSKQMKEQLLESNTHISASSIIVSGNPSFDRFYEYKPVNLKLYYGKKYRFDSERPIILYTMISPIAYDNEIGCVELINQKLIELYPDEKLRPVIVLRRNPIDEKKVDEDYFSGNNVRYADNYFDISHENAVFVQLNEGETEWMDLLYYADINMNVASTVTLEALMMQTPVINIEFDANGNQDIRLTRYANASFYAPLHNRQDVIVSSAINECLDAIEKFLSKEIIIEDIDIILDNINGQATEKILQKIMVEN